MINVVMLFSDVLDTITNECYQDIIHIIVESNQRKCRLQGNTAHQSHVERIV